MLTSYQPGDFELVKLVYGTIVAEIVAETCDEKELHEAAEDIRETMNDIKKKAKRRKKVNL